MRCAVASAQAHYLDSTTFCEASITSSATFGISDKALITQMPCAPLPQSILPEVADHRGDRRYDQVPSAVPKTRNQ
jgi:hypothetical protein